MRPGWETIPGAARYVMPTYRRSDGMIVRYDTTDWVWKADGDAAGCGTALQPGAVMDAVDQLFPIETEQRAVSVAVNQHGEMVVLTDAGRFYKLVSSTSYSGGRVSYAWEHLPLPPLPRVR